MLYYNINKYLLYIKVIQVNDILKISDIMTINLVTVNLDTSIYNIVKSMQEKKISSIIIVENNKPMGIITERDIVKASLSPEENLKKTASELMSSPVFTVEQDVDYRDAYMQMSEEKIRHLVVVDEQGGLLGMLSEGDFLNHLSPEQLLAIKEVSRIMTANVLTCSPRDSVHSVLGKMAEHRVGGIVVEENNQAIGMLSERDGLELIHKSNKELKEPITLYMSSPVITVHKEQTVLNAQNIMEDFGIRRIVVVDDDEKIAGIITRHDLIKSIPDYYVEILREMIERQKMLVSQTKIKLNEETIFHNAMKSLPHNLVFMTNKAGIVQFINTKDSQVYSLPEVEVDDELKNLEGSFFKLIKDSNWKEFVAKGKTLHKVVKIANKYGEFSYFNTENEFEGYMYIARDISEQQTLEKELIRLNDNLQEAYKVAKIGNWVLDAKTLNAFWSDEICDIFGLESSTLGGPNVLKELVDSKDFEIIKESLISALQLGSSHELIYEVFPKNGGESRWVECRAHRELDDDGFPKSLIGTLQNITHRVKAEKRIEQLNSLLKAIRNVNQLIVKEKKIEPLIEAICDEIATVKKFSGVWILLDEKKNYLYSAGFDEATLEKFEDNISKGIFPSCCSIRDKFQAYKTLPVKCGSCPLLKSYGADDAVVVPIMYENNFYGHIGLSIGDDLIKDVEARELVEEMANDIAFSIFTITEREKHKVELEKSYEMLYKLTENLPGAIYQYQLYPDGSSCFPYASKGIQNIYEVSPSDVLLDAAPVFMRLHKDDLMMVESSISKSAESMNEWNLEYRVDLPKQGLRWIHGKARPEKLDDGSILWHGVLTDITDEKELEDELRLFKRSVEASHEGIVITKVDEENNAIYVNPAFEHLTGYSEEDILGTNLSFLNDQNIEQPAIQLLYDAIKEEQSIEIELENYRKDGSRFISNLSIDPIFDANNKVTHFVGIQKDITKDRESERRLRQSATVFENTTEGVMITDVNSIIINVNDAFSNITGRERSEVIGKRASSLKSGRHKKDFYDKMWESISTTGTWQGEIWNRRKNGEVYPQWLNISSVRNKLGKVESYISVFSDITVLKETEEKLDFLAYHDHLTELPNRTLLKARLEHTMNAASRNKTLTAVMFMDIDNFKNINDSYGHTLGDELLIAVAKRINSIMKEDDTLARSGGDEFIVAMDHFETPNQIVHMVQRIMNLFEKSFMVDEKEFWITVSIGISISPDDGNTTEVLIKNADAALYEAKGDGKNTFKFYNKKMTSLCFERVVFENALKSAIKNKEFEVYYQPQEELLTNKTIGFEALIRWHHPTLGLISPDRFIPIAEDTKMILIIGEFVLRRACKDIKKWHDEGLCDGRVAVNVSGVQLEHSEFADILKYCLAHYDVDPSMIEIEITESMIMKNPDRWISILEEIKRIGVSISIDDFGTGYSSLSCLRRLPADIIKIDRSFIQDTPDENDACSIVNAIIGMSNSLGLETLAEGIETVEQRKFLLEQGCRYAQGYLLSKPMNGKDTYEWLKKRV